MKTFISVTLMCLMVPMSAFGIGYGEPDCGSWGRSGSTAGFSQVNPKLPAARELMGYMQNCKANYDKLNADKDHMLVGCQMQYDGCRQIAIWGGRESNWIDMYTFSPAAVERARDLKDELLRLYPSSTYQQRQDELARQNATR